MKDNGSFESIFPISRRNVLKAGAVTAVGVGLFSGTAAATNPRQINFCGCSQVCLDRAFNPDRGRDVGGVFHVIVAKEDGEGGWEFDEVAFGDDPEEEFQDFCFEPGDPYKIIAVRPGSNDLAYCNPGQCAQKALDAYAAENPDFRCVNDEDEDADPEPLWGEFDDITVDTVDNPQVEIVHGQCGKAGRTPNPGPNPGGPN